MHPNKRDIASWSLRLETSTCCVDRDNVNMRGGIEERLAALNLCKTYVLVALMAQMLHGSHDCSSRPCAPSSYHVGT